MRFGRVLALRSFGDKFLEERDLITVDDRNDIPLFIHEG